MVLNFRYQILQFENSDCYNMTLNWTSFTETIKML